MKGDVPITIDERYVKAIKQRLLFQFYKHFKQENTQST